MIKLMVASDIHGSAYYCKKMLEAFDREQADRLLRYFIPWTEKRSSERVRPKGSHQNVK